MAAGDRYVQIGREDLEGWLRRNFGSKWNRDQQFQGVYLIHLSDSVAIKLTSSIGRTDQVRGLGKASMKLTLVSRITGRTLNRKDKDRKSFMRTKGWEKTWLAGVRHWETIYQKYPDFYDRIGRGEDTKEKSQERSQAPSRSQSQTDDPFVSRLRLLWQAANKAGDNYVTGFAEDVGKRSQGGREPTERQRAFAEKQFRKYRIPENPRGQASRPKSDPYDEMARRLKVNRRKYTDKQMDELDKLHRENSDGSTYPLIGSDLEHVWEMEQPGYEEEDRWDEDPDYDIPYEAKYGPRPDRWASNVVLKHAARKVARRHGES